MSNVVNGQDATLQSLPELDTLQHSGRLYALGDLHLSFKGNREALSALTAHPEDTLILCGDVGESSDHLVLAFRTTRALFKHVVWVPGNHELYTLPPLNTPGRARGEAKYHECVALAREYGILTPEDPFHRWEGKGGPCIIAPLLTLYDYSFRPDNVSQERAVEWAKEEGVEATDEALLLPDPYPTKEAWCDALVTRAERKLEDAAAEGLPLVLVNHWPLRKDLVTIPRIPRFSIWCGTTRTKDWHTRFNAKVVVTGHLHVRRTDLIDGVRFEECSLGYPRQWQDARERGSDINDMMREILPGPSAPADGSSGTIWRRYG
jgi:predicted phosphodiesterase